MAAVILNLKQTAEIVGKHEKYFRSWLNSPKGERFRRVVKERERNQFNRREIQRWLDGEE